MVEADPIGDRVGDSWYGIYHIGLRAIDLNLLGNSSVKYVKPVFLFVWPLSNAQELSEHLMSMPIGLVNYFCLITMN